MKGIIFCLLMGISSSISAMGLRAFIALPLEREGMVFRFQGLLDPNKGIDVFATNFAYGISGKQTLFLEFPYRLSPAGSGRAGDLSALYRHIVWQQDMPGATNRLGLLGGVFIPTKSTSDGGAQVGAVATFYKRRHELDVDGLWGQGFGVSLNTVRYDISYQYRLIPSVYPETDLGAEWDAVVEYNGRWREDTHLIHQITIGLQWIHARWVLEGGASKDINSPQDVLYIISTRIHV